MAKVTLQSIADKVGVSRMTVSNAFSRPDQLSAELRERILEAAAELGYVGPDPAARALAKGRTGSVGLLLNGQLTQAFEDQVSSAFLAAVSDELSARGLALTVLTPPTSNGFFPARDVAMDGVLVYTCEPDSAGVSWLERRGVPMVAVDQDLGDAVPRVIVDDRGGARAGARHLVDLGHRRIGILTISDGANAGLSASRPARERMAGWREVLDDAGIEPVVAIAPYEPRTEAYGIALDLLRGHDLTGLLCFSDVFAYAAVRAADELGREVPRDLSVVGYDDNPLAAAVRPPLTTVRQDITAKGRSAVSTLVEVMGAERPESVMLDTELVVRESTGPAPRD